MSSAPENDGPLSPLQNHSYESFPTPLPSSADAATIKRWRSLIPNVSSRPSTMRANLQNLANWLLRSERSSITLQSDDLVHETPPLTRSNTLQWENRRQLVNLIIETMRRILIDHARERQHSGVAVPIPKSLGRMELQSTLQKHQKKMSN